MELSRAYSNPKLVVFDDTIQTPEIPQADLVIMRAGYEALISKIPSSFFSENPATALMVKKEITSFQPDVEEYENYLRFVSDVTGDVKEGYMVEDPDGAYVWVGSDTMGQYVYVGDVNTPSLLLNYDYGEDSEVETDEEEIRPKKWSETHTRCARWLPPSRNIRQCRHTRRQPFCCSI